MEGVNIGRCFGVLKGALPRLLGRLSYVFRPLEGRELYTCMAVCIAL